MEAKISKNKSIASIRERRRKESRRLTKARAKIPISY
jgi:hypothetical protein